MRGRRMRQAPSKRVGWPFPEHCLVLSGEPSEVEEAMISGDLRHRGMCDRGILQLVANVLQPLRELESLRAHPPYRVEGVPQAAFLDADRAAHPCEAKAVVRIGMKQRFDARHEALSGRTSPGRRVLATYECLHATKHT